MDEPIRQRGFAVVDMGDDGKIANQGVAHEKLEARKRAS
jgi:hypothetical protein